MNDFSNRKEFLKDRLSALYVKRDELDILIESYNENSECVLFNIIQYMSGWKGNRPSVRETMIPDMYLSELERRKRIINKKIDSLEKYYHDYLNWE